MQKESLQEIAQKMLDRASGDVESAALALTTRASKSPALFRRIMSPGLRQACYDLIRGQCRNNRQAIWHTPQPTISETRSSVASLASATIATTRTLMQFPLPGGMYIENATRGDLREAIGFYSLQASDMSAKARWLSLIESKLRNDDVTVGEVLNLAVLQKLRAEADGDVPYDKAAE